MGSSPCQNKTKKNKKKKKKKLELTLHSVCEDKVFGQVTVEKDYNHSGYMTKCDVCLARVFVTHIYWRNIDVLMPK